MENLTNQVLTLASGKNYLVLRQAAYRGNVYYLGAEVTPDGEDFTNEFVFFERVEKDGKFNVKKVTDPEILQVLGKNIKLD
jgi:hypothetical protein